MKWIKRGLTYVPDGSLPWAKSHAHLPTPYRLGKDIIRVYFAALDAQMFGRITYVDVSASDPSRVLNVSNEIALDVGELGCFDSCGAVPSCIVDVEGTAFLYYVGFQRAVDVPYMLFGGLATAHTQSNTFERVFRTPVLDRTPDEPFSRAAPFVVRENDSYRMWYWSCLKWTQSDRGVHYNTVIRHARSNDAIHWIADHDACIEPVTPDEYAVGRPCVIREGGIYKMWYSTRAHSKPYVIGYAESEDGLKWERLDTEAGISMSESGWDSEMICYPAIIDVDGHKYMFYNGNGHGRTGFGCAVAG